MERGGVHGTLYVSRWRVASSESSFPGGADVHHRYLRPSPLPQGRVASRWPFWVRSKSGGVMGHVLFPRQA
jgi:hypothetical protein